MAPVQRLAERVASTAVPEAPRELPPSDRLALYREQARIPWAEGVLDARGRLLLRSLREGLG